MGAGWTNAEEIKILQYVFAGGVDDPAVAQTWVALFTAEPDDTGTYVEIAYQNYLRQPITSGQWAPAAGGDPTTMANSDAITYPVAGATGAAIATHWGLMTADGDPTPGLLLFSGAVTIPAGGLPISEGIQPQFAIGALILQLGDLP